MQKFFNKPQLGGTQLQQAEQTNETGVDQAANAKARQADQSVDQLLSIGQSALGIAGTYQRNIEAKDRLESNGQIPFYKQMVEQELANTENLESLGRDGLNSKFNEMSETFLERYKDKPYTSQLKRDIEGLRGSVLTGMIAQRDGLHVKKVADATAQNASDFASLFSSGSMDEDGMRESLTQLMQESTLAHQVPSSTELELSDEAREKYRSLTNEQARDAVMRGLMVQTGQPNNSKVAQLLASQEFRESMGINDADEDYNKMVAHAYKKGVQADKVVYSKGIDTFKEQLYGITNMGIPVNIDQELEGFKKSGQQITAQDEHKLRKAFKVENDLVIKTEDYVENMKSGKDILINATPKERESHLNRAFSESLNLTVSGVSIDGITANLIQDETAQHKFRENIIAGIPLPKDVIKLFNEPAGQDPKKWDSANNAIMSMEAATIGTGRSIEAVIGVNQVSKIRGMSRLLNDETMDESVKQNAIKELNERSTTFNSKGYLQGTADTKVDTEWLTEVSTDAPWTTDDYVSSSQNADEIAGNYQAFRLAGHNADKAQELALDLFKESNRNFEMPNGNEIAIPIQHAYLNNESIVEFSKDADRFPSIREERDALEATTGQGWISEWRADSEVSIQKSYSFAKTGKYDMLFRGRLVKNSSFTYEEMQDFIGNQDRKTRSRITGVETERPFKEVEAEALENRKKKINKQISKPDPMQHLFDLKI